MAEAGTLCINADVLKFAGAGANSTYTAEAYTNVYILMAEGEVSASTRYDWVTNYSSVNDIGKEFLRLATASLAGIFAINADMSGYSSPIEADSMKLTLYTIHNNAIKMLEDKKREDFMVP